MRSAALAFLLGILLVQQLPELPSLWWGALLVPLVLLARWQRAAVPLAFFVAGLCWAALRADLVLQETLPMELEGQDLRVEGFIADIPRPGEHGLRFEFDVVQAKHHDRLVTIPRHIEVSTYGAAFEPKVGDKWALPVRLKRPHGFQNPGGFDYEAYLFQHRIRALGYVREMPLPELLSSDPGEDRLGRFRQYLTTRIAALLPDNAFAGMVTGFANGDESAVGDQQWRVLARTGTTHLIAISGMNISLVAGLVFFLVRWLWSLPGVTVLWWPAPRAGALAALLAGWFYAALAGFAIPTQRALVMLAVVMAGILWGRRRSPSYLLAVALLLVLVIDPLAVLAAGFWLSFAAVALILYVSHPGQARATWRERWRAWTGMQWAIAVGMLPLMLVLFQQTSLIGPFANLIAIPMVESLVIPLTLLGVTALVALPSIVATGLFQLAAWSLEKLWVVLEALATLDHTQWAQHTPQAWTVACAVIGVLVLLAPRGFPARWVGVLWVAPMLWLRPPGPAPGEVWFTLLDVGQGLAAVARTATHTLVYDSGPRWSSRFDAGRAVVAPFLRHSGVARIDTLIVSHAHNDHIGGAASLMEALPVERILSSVPERLAGAEHCRAGQHWEWDGVRFDILHPGVDTAWRENNASCVLRIVDSRGTILLPGDIAAAAERVLVAAGARDLKAEVLVAPHHGSGGSSTAVFIDAVSPRLVLYPVGYRNRHRHPNPAVVERYAWVGAEAHESPRDGAMTVRLGPDGPELSAYREQRPRYWLNRPVNTWEASR